MKKSPKGEVVLSPCQIQAARLNQVERHRYERNIELLREDLNVELARIHRQGQTLKFHFNNVVRNVKPNRAYELWKQTHAHELAQQEAREFLASFKRKQKLTNFQRSNSTMNEQTSKPLRPLLLLVEDESKKPVEPMIDITNSFLRPGSSPFHRTRTNPFLNTTPSISNPTSTQQQPSNSIRANPILAMLNGRPASSNVYRRQPTQVYESPSFSSTSSTGSPGSRKLIQGQFVTTHKKSDLDALYRMALQNQTAYKAVEQTRIVDRKLHDKEFASKHRALMGSMRSSGIVN